MGAEHIYPLGTNTRNHLTVWALPGPEFEVKSWVPFPARRERKDAGPRSRGWPVVRRVLAAVLFPTALLLLLAARRERDVAGDFRAARVPGTRR